MSNTEKLVMLRAMVGNQSNTPDWSDDILLTYLTIAGRKIIDRAYPYEDVTEVPKRYSVLQCEIAAYLLNKRGAEGEISHSENGISRSYENADIPKSLIGQVVTQCGVLQ